MSLWRLFDLSRFHLYWMAVSRGGECGVSYLKNGTNFRVREATIRKIPVCTDLKWGMVFTLFLFNGVSFTVDYCIYFSVYSAVWRLCTEMLVSGRASAAGETPHFLYFELTALWGICSCIVLCDESFEENVNTCVGLSLFASFPGMWQIAPTSWEGTPQIGHF